VPAKGGAFGAGSAGPDAPRGDVPPQMEHEPETAKPITLIDETGRERQFQLHDAFDHDGAVYYLVENIDDPSQVLLLREVDGALETVDGEEFKQVIAALEKDQVE
jgi:uncharacterized protein YrzB (UPF0473 family)